MAKPRAAQFAKDIGVSTNQAKKLINEGRRRRDGGSNILEATMAETEKMTLEEKMLTEEQRKELRKAFAGEERPKLGRAPVLTKEDIRKMQDVEFERDGMRMVPVVKRGKGGLQVRGMGAAYVGNPREVKIR